MADSLRDFEEQLQQEALAKTGEEVQFTADEYTIGGTLVRKDPDGTVYEFDPEKHAWFPKVAVTYQMHLVLLLSIHLLLINYVIPPLRDN